MCTELSHCPCPVMYTKHYTDSSTSREEAKSTLLIHVPPSSMDRRSNMQTRWTQHSISRIKKITSFNRCAALFCIMPLPSITLFSLHSEIFPQSNPNPQTNTAKQVAKILNYLASNPQAEIQDRNDTFSMPSYVHKSLRIFQHTLRGVKEYSTHTSEPIQYGQKIQYADPLYTA